MHTSVTTVCGQAVSPFGSSKHQGRYLWKASIVEVCGQAVSPFGCIKQQGGYLWKASIVMKHRLTKEQHSVQ